MVKPHHLNNRIHIAVIGGNGFIGRNLIRKLSQQSNLRIWSIDSNEHGVSIDTSNSRAIIEQVTSKVGRGNFISDFISNRYLDYIVYCAGCESPTDGLHPSYKYEVEDLKTLVSTLEALRHSPVDSKEDKPPYFMYLSSWSVYGFNRKKLSKETNNRLPANYSGMIKNISEDFVHRLCNKTGCEYSILRPTEVYGRQHHRQLKDGKWKGYVSYYSDLIVKRPEIVNLYSPNTKLDLVHVNYLTKVMCYLLAKNIEGTFNVSSGRSISISELFQKIKEKYEKSYGNTIKLEIKPTSILRLEDMTLDSSKILKTIPYDFAKYNLDKFLEDYIRVRRLELAKDMTIEQIKAEKFLADTTAYGAKEGYLKRMEKRKLDYSLIKEIAGPEFEYINYARFNERAKEVLTGKQPKLIITESTKNKDKLLEDQKKIDSLDPLIESKNKKLVNENS